MSYSSASSYSDVCEAHNLKMSNNTNNTSSNDLYLENDGNRFNSVVLEAFFQLIIWHFIISYTRSYVAKHCQRKKWFIQWAKKPDGKGGETGGGVVIYFLGTITQHTFSATLLCLAYYLPASPLATQLFITGALGEFAFEVLDLKGHFFAWRAKYMSTGSFVNTLMHHSGAIFGILPVCIYYADNAYVHQIGLGLMGFGASSIILLAISSSRDITDLRERGQFMVIEVLSFLSMIYLRWIVAVPGMYWFLYEEWATMSTTIRIAMIAYMVFIKLFDLLLFVKFAKRTYGFLIGGKGTKKSTKITVSSLKRAPSTPFHLLRMQSAPLF